MIIRPAEARDAQALADIYGHAVRTGLGTFETEPPDAAAMEARRVDVQGRGLPFLVAEADGRVLGYAYASPFRMRAGYRYTAEDSVYVAPDAAGRGVGKAVLAPVIAACEAAGVRQLVAVIGDSGNAASIGLHTSLGFEHAGVGRSLGYKHDRWVDIVWMQKALGGGDTTTPTAPGLDLSS